MASELQRLIKKANSGDMSAIATLSRSYDGTSGIGTDTRTKEEIEAGNRRVWQNTVDGFKKISYIIGEFFSVNDAYRLTTGKDPETGENASRIEAAGWLTADFASFGISKVAKGGKIAGKGLKALDKVNDASKATKAADKASGNLLPMTLDNLQMFAKKPLKVDNMSEFFRTEFGTKIKSSLKKTSKQQQGQSIYEVVDKGIDGLKKGDQLYLDAMHKDHFEVFNKNGKISLVLNLDGSVNLTKTELAIRQGRRLK
ncbi:Hemolysin/hemagglutinin-like protein HecA precursor [Streptococcus oralis]|uniref:Hemolysin/hemagglutinin-like protein HecA n=2 Tax=Streptococcus oralis TaxID=1303 RepID=A0A139P8K0_STROR|nr:Hemolysin/hemagglutinin-like protein HecA precursor [Streptococcus oralis]